MKIKKIHLPASVIIHKGKKDAKNKTFVKRGDSKFRTAFTDYVESSFTEFTTQCCQELIIQTSSERKRISLCCLEYTRLRALSNADDIVEASRRSIERKHLEDEVVSLNDSIGKKITYTAETIHRAINYYNAALTAYYSGLNTGLDVDQNGMVVLSIEYGPYADLMTGWAKERRNVEAIIALIKGDEAS